MSLGADRRKFTSMLSDLIRHIEHELRYGVAIKFVYRCEDCPIGHKNSLHHKSLAADLDLYSLDGEYLSSGFEHDEIHDFWDDLGGNERIDNDMNHYSYGDYGGVR